MVLMLCIAGFTNSVFAAEDVVISLTSTRDGNYIDVRVVIESNPGMASFQLMLNFDSDRLTPALPASRGGMLIDGIFSSSSSGNVVQLYFVSPQNITETGLMFIVRFRIIDNIGNFFFDMCSNSMMINQNGEVLNISWLNLTVPPYEVFFIRSDITIETSVMSGTVEVIVRQNSSNEPMYANSILAIFDSENRMMYAQHKSSVFITRGDNPVIFTDIAFPARTNERYTARIFLWEIETMKPLADYDVGRIN